MDLVNYAITMSRLAMSSLGFISSSRPLLPKKTYYIAISVFLTPPIPHRTTLCNQLLVRCSAGSDATKNVILV